LAVPACVVKAHCGAERPKPAPTALVRGDARAQRPSSIGFERPRGSSLRVVPTAFFAAAVGLLAPHSGLAQDIHALEQTETYKRPAGLPDASREALSQQASVGADAPFEPADPPDVAAGQGDPPVPT